MWANMYLAYDFWDNRATMRYPIDDWGGTLDSTRESPRQMNRITIQAAVPS